jgi:hypothetical protein
LDVNWPWEREYIETLVLEEECIKQINVLVIKKKIKINPSQ